jgi:hypothetical protein
VQLGDRLQAGKESGARPVESMNPAKSAQQTILHAKALETVDLILRCGYGEKVTALPGLMVKRRGAEQGSLHPKYAVSRTRRTR